MGEARLMMLSLKRSWNMGSHPVMLGSSGTGSGRYISHDDVHEINTLKCPIQTQCV